MGRWESFESENGVSLYPELWSSEGLESLAQGPNSDITLPTNGFKPTTFWIHIQNPYPPSYTTPHAARICLCGVFSAEVSEQNVAGLYLSKKKKKPAP